ncbi:hypothetical protein K432DRAFT_457114 [Lepidopterella palustris CBS 459.81]|uniref:Uncharacterized protein n=1 Tax=Lepidopterella palustris CBS 459.81 TaxID=1314670 RepID=A0A8E2EJ39_9PEZI|nr:hypothetical protein K432DRAFT_457114 [Lepidopterella palustris CBS 459.81]
MEIFPEVIVGIQYPVIEAGRALFSPIPLNYVLVSHSSLPRSTLFDPFILTIRMRMAFLARSYPPTPSRKSTSSKTHHSSASRTGQPSTFRIDKLPTRTYQLPQPTLPPTKTIHPPTQARESTPFRIQTPHPTPLPTKSIHPPPPILNTQDAQGVEEHLEQAVFTDAELWKIRCDRLFKQNGQLSRECSHLKTQNSQLVFQVQNTTGLKRHCYQLVMEILEMKERLDALARSFQTVVQWILANTSLDLSDIRGLLVEQVSISEELQDQNHDGMLSVRPKNVRLVKENANASKYPEKSLQTPAQITARSLTLEEADNGLIDLDDAAVARGSTAKRTLGVVHDDYKEAMGAAEMEMEKMVGLKKKMWMKCQESPRNWSDLSYTAFCPEQYLPHYRYGRAEEVPNNFGNLIDTRPSGNLFRSRPRNHKIIQRSMLDEQQHEKESLRLPPWLKPSRETNPCLEDFGDMVTYYNLQATQLA